MKRIILSALLVVAVSLASFAKKTVAEGKTYSALGDYKIQIDDKAMTINGKQHVPYVITYENSDMEVRVAIDMDRNSKTYYVISDDLSVQYTSNRKYFGVEKLAKELENEGLVTSETSLNREEYFRQKVISSDSQWRDDKTSMVAAFFPLLLNNVEKVLAAK